MSRLGGLLGRKPQGDRHGTTQTDLQDFEPEPRSQAPLPPVTRQDNALGIDEDLFSPVVQMGEENEAVRNLLLDAELRMNELDSIKETFSRVLEPVNKALRDFEREKAERVGLQTLLTTTRAAYSKMRSDFASAEKRLALFESESERLKDDLGAALQNLRLAETMKSEQTVENTTQRTKLAELDRRMQQETMQRDAMLEETRRLTERLGVADKRIGQMEADAENARQKALLSEKERASLQATLDQSHEEIARVSRRLDEAEKAFAATHARLLQTEASLAESNNERARITSTLDDATERHRSELASHNARFETLQTRALTTEKLLDDSRQNMSERADEIRNHDRRFIEATLTRNTLESKLIEIERANAEREAQVQELEQTRNALMERTVALTKTVTVRESDLARAEQKVTSLSQQIGLIEVALQNAQHGAEQQIETLNAELQREKLERATAQGALEAGRKDFARIFSELMALQGKRETASAEAQVPVNPATSAGPYAPLPVPKYNNAA